MAVSVTGPTAKLVSPGDRPAQSESNCVYLIVKNTFFQVLDQEKSNHLIIVIYKYDNNGYLLNIIICFNQLSHSLLLFSSCSTHSCNRARETDSRAGEYRYIQV